MTTGNAWPKLREFYLQMAWEKERNKRTWDMGVSEYYPNRVYRLGYEGFWNAAAWRADIKKRRKKNKRKQRY